MTTVIDVVVLVAFAVVPTLIVVVALVAFIGWLCDTVNGTRL